MTAKAVMEGKNSWRVTGRLSRQVVTRAVAPGNCGVVYGVV